jgi:V/A-type H+-transporting ATPase subunit E
MENKLQELTKKLYDEGLSKGRAEADTLITNAKTKAVAIIAEAQADAEKIKAEAQTHADDLRRNTLTELKLAGEQAIGKLKSTICDLITAKSSGESVAAAVKDPEFIKTTLTAIVNNWHGTATGNPDLKVLLPAADKQKFDANFEQSVRGALKNNIDIEWSAGQKSGFSIGPKEGGYYISFDEDSFNALLGEYLRPKVRTILYGNDNK